MALKVDYYTSLLRAVGGLDRDAYAARGAIYEREHKALMRLLYSADPPRAEIEIEREQLAFRDAMRRVEFGDDEQQVPLAPLRGPPPEVPMRAVSVAAEPTSATPIAATPPTVPSVIPRRAAIPAPAIPASPIPQPAMRAAVTPAPAPDPVIRVAAIPATASPDLAPRSAVRVAERDRFTEPSIGPQVDVPEDPDLAPGQPAFAPEGMLDPEAPQAQDEEPADLVHLVVRPRRSIRGLLLRRAVLAVLLLGLGAVGYGYATGDVPLPWLTDLVGDGTLMQLGRDPNAQQAIVFDGESRESGEGGTSGKAVWRMRSEPAGAPGEATTVLQLDMEIPTRRLAMTMSIRPEAASSALSHLVELRFLRDDQQPDAEISNILGIYMTTAEQTRRAPLSGRVMRVAPGVFLFGLVGQDADREQNLRSLKELTWLDIPLVYRNGVYGLLAIEKGAAGERVVNETLAKWGQ